MDKTRGREKDVCGLEGGARFSANKFTAARSYEIDFIARVGILRIVATRCVDLNKQCSVLKDSGESWAIGAGEALKGVRNRQFCTRGIHGDLPRLILAKAAMVP